MADNIDYGKWLEKKLVQEAELQNYTLIKVPEKFVGFYGKRPAKQLPTPFDYCGSVGGRAIFFDAKACGKTSFDLNTYVFHEKKVHQYRNLLRVHSRGDVAGFVLWLYNLKRIGFISVVAVRDMRDQGLKSINLETPNFIHHSDHEPFRFLNLVPKT